MYIGGTRVCADWFTLKRRALPIAIFNSSSALAPALAPPLLTVLMLAFGWRAMFLLAGLAGLAVALAWIRLYRAPHEAGIPRQDIETIHSEDTLHFVHLGLAQLAWLLQFRTAWGMFFGFFGVVYLSWMYATWLPGYLETQLHLSVASAGFWSAVPLAAGFAGAVAGGFITDLLGPKRHGGRARLPPSGHFRPAGCGRLHRGGGPRRKRRCRHCLARGGAVRGECGVELRLGAGSGGGAQQRGRQP